MELLSKACVSPSNTQWCIPLLGTGYSLRLGGKRRRKSHTPAVANLPLNPTGLSLKQYGTYPAARRNPQKLTPVSWILVSSRQGPQAFKKGLEWGTYSVRVLGEYHEPLAQEHI